MTFLGADSVISSAFSDDPDSFIVGDRVWVQGSKPAVIQYIGEVQFAKGEWAGVVLDKPEGKNDGSVHGGESPLYFTFLYNLHLLAKVTKSTTHDI